MEIFPATVLSLWNKCELRVLVLLSLLWQVILIILGPMRKHKRGGIKGVILSSVVWGTYLSADWLATVALGNLATNQIAADTSNSKAESKDQVLQALWAPFLLLHLGGPDTITAYSLEDNSLWMRHLLGLIVQVSVAFYIFLRSWSSNNSLTFVAIPVFVSGIIKYSERNWVLRSATTDQFRKTLPSEKRVHVPNSDLIHKDPKLECIHKGYSLFPLVKRLYANLGLDSNDLFKSFGLTDIASLFEMDSLYVFEVVQVQLGFLFDVLYTKASIIYTKKGLLLRLVSALSITGATVAFILVIDSDDAYSRVDVVITHVLLIGAIFLELYAFLAITLSDWTVRWLTKRERSNCLLKLVYSSISRFRSSGNDKLYMSQLSLVDLSLTMTTGSCIENYLFSKILPLEFNLLRNQRLEEVDTYMKDVIRQEMKGWKDKSHFDLSLEDRNVLAITVLKYHIETDILYHYSSTTGLGGEHITDVEELKCKREVSKKISDYLFYLLLQRPSMLPPWIGGIEYIQDTISHAQELCRHVESPADAVKILYDYVNKGPRVKEIVRKSFLQVTFCETSFDWRDRADSGVRLLISIPIHLDLDWRSHAQLLPSGGEFLTHVTLLLEYYKGGRDGQMAMKEQLWVWFEFVWLLGSGFHEMPDIRDDLPDVGVDDDFVTLTKAYDNGDDMNMVDIFSFLNEMYIKVMEIFPATVLSLWNKYELRVLVLLSLLWQVILIILGPMRKHKRGGIKGVILRSVVWVTYLSADWLATVALGNLATNQIDADKSNSKAESKDQVLQALWAPCHGPK
ncbi:hypothetical protein PIB30_033522 [Stylosanthes scabra]|uniref:DUF4220 domain-containing protein n=1 Tax=Stylosanthes scabra TaxID=79078 RepID=A0ABU6RD43_9FABA|nr:hypothetical protein [Stylosanthes scabra]